MDNFPVDEYTQAFWENKLEVFMANYNQGASTDATKKTVRAYLTPWIKYLL